MLHNYVLSKSLSGTNEKDLEPDIQQLCNEDGTYEIADPKGFIADNMFEYLEYNIDVGYDFRHIRNLLNNDGKYGLVVSDSNPLVKKIVVTVNSARNLYYYDILGDNIVYRQIYTVEQIDDADVGYLVSEHLIGLSRKCKLVTRCYHELFINLRDAVAYRDVNMKDYAVEKGSSHSGFRIFVVNAYQMRQSKWYKDNLEICDLIRKYKLKLSDYRYMLDLDSVREAIRADAYDDLPLSERAAADRLLCELMYPFIDDSIFDDIDDDFDAIPDEDMESVADDMILFALLSVKSEKEFYAVHKKLGPYGYRVGALTDAIYNSHPKQGTILMCVDGNMRWYSDSYAIGEWEGARGNPYFGKFQPNECNTLLCLREYHPELIVNVFPTSAELEKYMKLYNEERAEERNKHPEMVVETNDVYDVTICRGNWYPNGVYNDEFMKDATFFVFYENYTFSRNQCRKLLSGEELVITNYKSKMGRDLTIRGKLKQTNFGDIVNMEFTRTDISARNRRIMNAFLGVEEPGLPEDED